MIKTSVTISGMDVDKNVDHVYRKTEELFQNRFKEFLDKEWQEEWGSPPIVKFKLNTENIAPDFSEIDGENRVRVQEIWERYKRQRLHEIQEETSS